MKVLLLTSLLLSACAKDVVKKPNVSDPEKFFKDKKGCFLLYNMRTNTFDKVIGEDHCRERMTAFSTFKVPLAVMAFDAGVLRDEHQVFKWNGVKDPRPEVNQDHNAKTWMRDSVVWFSQKITPKLGAKKFQKYLNDFNYGNKDFSQGLTDAWLTSPAQVGKGLQISPYEQVEFMRKLWANELPVSKRAMRLTREITFLEVSPQGYRLSGKTGSNFYDKKREFRAGWFISHLENEAHEYVAVTNFSDVKAAPGSSYGGLDAKRITKEILASLNLW